MRIGIDIDDTLTNIKDDVDCAALKYAQQLGKNINKNIDDFNNKIDGNSYQKRYNFTYDELKYFLKEIQENITKNATPRDYARECISNLRKKGHQIYIITARVSEFHDDPYKLSEDWLDKNNIEYDKIIVNARKKAPICLSEKIDLFIDDQIGNCIDISNFGIKVIRISDDKTIYENILTFNNWNSIYKYINEME